MNDEHRWLVRAIVLAQFGPAFMFSGVAVALPKMGDELQLSATTLGLVETTFLASSCAFLLPSGRLADAASRGAIFRWMLLAFGVLSLLIGCVSNGSVVLVLRFVQGLTAALCMTAGPAWIVDLVPVGRRGRVFGSMMGTAYAGLALGPLCAGHVVEALGWRSVFFVGGALILVVGIPALVHRTEPFRMPRRSLHLPSVALLLLGLGAVVVSVSMLEVGWPAWPSLALAAASLSCFVWWQPRLSAPLLDLRELRCNGELRAALLVQMLLYLNAYCSVFLLSLFLQVCGGLDARGAGLWLAVGAVVMTCTSPFAGRLADRMQPRRVAGLGVVFVLASSLVGLQLDARTEPYMVAVVLGLQGMGFGLFSSPNLALIVGSLPRERGGFASALAAQSRSIGMVTGMTVTSALIAVHFGDRPVKGDVDGVADTLRSAYQVLVSTSALALLSVALSAARRRSRPASS